MEPKRGSRFIWLEKVTILLFFSLFIFFIVVFAFLVFPRYYHTISLTSFLFLPPFPSPPFPCSSLNSPHHTHSVSGKWSSPFDEVQKIGKTYSLVSNFYYEPQRREEEAWGEGERARRGKRGIRGDVGRIAHFFFFFFFFFFIL